MKKIVVDVITGSVAEECFSPEEIADIQNSPKPPAPTYQELRAAEYPPMADYLDAVVKGDDAQMQAYIDACLAIKAKYPKP